MNILDLTEQYHKGVSEGKYETELITRDKRIYILRRNLSMIGDLVALDPIIFNEILYNKEGKPLGYVRDAFTARFRSYAEDHFSSGFQWINHMGAEQRSSVEEMLRESCIEYRVLPLGEILRIIEGQYDETLSMKAELKKFLKSAAGKIALEGLSFFKR
jgi:hypothetical protein